jgi:hypothetical protein
MRSRFSCRAWRWGFRWRFCTWGGGDDCACGTRYGAGDAAGVCAGVGALMSDPGRALLVFAVSAVALPLVFLAAWGLFKGLLS